MNNTQRWVVIAAALLLAAVVGVMAYNAGIDRGIEQSGKIVVAAPGVAPWGFGFFFVPFFFFAFWVVIFRGLFWRGGWHRRGYCGDREPMRGEGQAGS